MRDELFVRSEIAKHADQGIPFIGRIADAKAFLDFVGDATRGKIFASGLGVLVLFLKLGFPKFECDLV